MCSCGQKSDVFDQSDPSERRDIFDHVNREDLPKSRRGPWNCDRCEKVCKTAYLLDCHVKSKHVHGLTGGVAVTEVLPSTPRRSQRVCSSSSAPVAEGQTEGQSFPLQCDLCGRSYQTRKWLQKHMLDRHNVGSVTLTTLSLNASSISMAPPPEFASQTAVPQPNLARCPCPIPECFWTGATAGAVKTHMRKKHGSGSTTLPSLPLPVTLLPLPLNTSSISVAPPPEFASQTAAVPQPGLAPRCPCPIPECPWTGATAGAVKTHMKKKH